MAEFNWNDLRAFLAVARTGRLSAAAARLEADHTTVGRRISALEAELGARLFDRTPGGHVLTPHGERLMPMAETMESLAIRVAGELGATKVALGHHRDDILETFFLNFFYGGKLKAMPPKLVSDDGKNVLIRPLANVAETDLQAYADWREFPIIPCTLCGSQPNLKRQEVKRLLQDWHKRYPGRVENMFAALGRVTPSHLMDNALFDFAGLQATDAPWTGEQDMAFDPDPAFSGADTAPAGDGAPIELIRMKPLTTLR